MKLCDGLYSYVWKSFSENNCNMFYIGEPFNMLFDPGLKNHVDTRLNEIKQDGLNPEDIKYIVNTHSHPDHFEGAECFKDKNTKLCMHGDEINFYNQEGPGFCQMFGMPFITYEFDEILKEGKWEVEGNELEIFHTPGHSPGSVCIYWKEKKALICGDLVFEQSFGRVDFPGGDGKLLKESILKISELDIEYLLPGHMNIITGADNVKQNFEIVKQHFSMV